MPALPLLAESPGGGAANDRVRVRERIDRGLDHLAIACVGTGDEGIADEAPALGPADGAAAEYGPEALLGQAGDLGESDPLVDRSGAEGRLPGLGSLPVPGAHFLADVASKEVISDSVALVRRNRGAQLDREVGDAPGRIEHPLFEDRACGAGVEADPAASAAVFGLGVVFQLEVEEKLAEKCPGPDLRVDDHRVLGGPAGAGGLGEIPLEDRRRVHGNPPPRPGSQCLDEPHQALEPFPQQVVVVLSGRVARQAAEDAGSLSPSGASR